MKLNNVLKAVALCGLVITFVSSCGNNSQSGEYGYKELYPNADKITFDDFKIVKLSKDVPLGSIYKIKVEESLIFIHSSDERLYSFNMDGSYKTAYGMQGRAGNEYINLSAFYVDKKAKQVCIIDASLGKLLYYDYDGNFIRKQELEALNSKLIFPYDVRLLPDGRLFVHNRIFNDSGLLFAIIDINDGTITDFKSVPFSTANTAEYCGEHLCNLFDGHLYYLLPFDPNIYVLDGDKGTVLREIPGVENVPTEKELEGITDYNFFTEFNMYNEGYFAGFSGLYETDSLIFLNELEMMNYYIIDKNSGKQKRYEYSLDDDIKTLPIKGIKATYQDWLIGVSDPMNLIQMNEDMPENPSDPYLKKLRDTAGKTTIESNPILLFYKIKSIQ
jgi:hypothetical protein